MSWKEFSDDCPGCQPVVLDVSTGQRMPDDHPIMQSVMAAWKATTLEQRQAYHAVMCNNSRLSHHMQIVEKLLYEMMRNAGAQNLQ